MGDISYALQKASVVDVLAPAEVAATAAGAGLDLSAYYGTAKVILTCSNVSGSSPTLDIKLQGGTDPDLIGTVTYSGTGNGTCTDIHAEADCVTESITVTFSGASDFAVVGGTSGSLGSGTVGTKFTSTVISFMITAGTVAFVNLDAFTIPVTARTWADISGYAFTQCGGTASTQSLIISDCNKFKRYLRAYKTIGGTSTPKFRAAVTLVAIAK